MPDWTRSMEQSYEFYTVEPTSLADVKRLDKIKTASFSRESDSATLGSATIDSTEALGETYVRCYLKTNQNGVIEKHPLGTVLVQSPSSSFNGIITSVTMDAYTPLIELKEKQPPLGYCLRKGDSIMEKAYEIVRRNTRAPVSKVEPVTVTHDDGTVEDISPKLEFNFVANADDTWLTFVSDLIAYAKYDLGLDERGHIMFVPKQDLSALQPVWTFDDSNSSILYPDITVDQDLYGIPNVVEVIYVYEGVIKTVTVRNEDPNSPTSTVSRGREITYRDTNPNLSGYVTDEQVEEYAERLLRELSTIECNVSYTHGYCPVRVGDCVRLNYADAGITNIKAKVVSQSIKTDLPCSVSEKAIFTKKLWG